MKYHYYFPNIPKEIAKNGDLYSLVDQEKTCTYLPILCDESNWEQQSKSLTLNSYLIPIISYLSFDLI